MSPDEKKQAAARAALDYVEPGMIVGIGTGSTANHFIDFLAEIKGKIDGTVASSEASAERLRSHGIQVLDLGQTGTLPVYVDGADEATKNLHLIKGGGGALTREKIVAQSSEKFVCIADQGKLVDTGTGSYFKYYDDDVGPRLRAWREAENDRFIVRTGGKRYLLEVRRFN